MVTFQPDQPFLTVGRWLSGQFAQRLDKGVGPRGNDRGIARAAHFKTCATGEKLRRCSGQAPCRRSAARCSAVP